MRWFIKLFLILGVVSLTSLVVVWVVLNWVQSVFHGVPFGKVVVEFVLSCGR
jgi:hypothetical protein